MINSILVIHLLAATIWTGGHLVLTLGILPKVLMSKNIKALLTFELQYEKLALIALLVQIVTGLWMAYQMMPNPTSWFTLTNDLSILISLKLSILLAVIIIALNARLRIIPNLSAKTLNWFALHVLCITLLSIGFVIVGSMFRTGFSH